MDALWHARLGGSLALPADTRRATRICRLAIRLRHRRLSFRSCHDERREGDAMGLGPGDLLGIREAAALLPTLLRRPATARSGLARKRSRGVLPEGLMRGVRCHPRHGDGQHHQPRHDQQHTRCQPSAGCPISEMPDPVHNLSLTQRVSHESPARSPRGLLCQSSHRTATVRLRDSLTREGEARAEFRARVVAPLRRDSAGASRPPGGGYSRTQAMPEPACCAAQRCVRDTIQERCPRRITPHRSPPLAVHPLFRKSLS